MPQRTESIAVEKDFTFDSGSVVKSWTAESGERFVRGVASGVKVDRDGERVSKRAIQKMAQQASQGGVKLTSSHQQDWATEIGDVVKAQHDPDTDELVVDCKLPPEGEDPLADKAWSQLSRGRELGFSIGGKLRKAFYEVADVGKRKVLDDILLRHVALTDKPAYAESFAHAVAKTFDADDVDALPVFDVDEDEPLDSDEVEKGLSPSTQGQGGDSKTGDRFAGRRKKGAPLKTEDPDDENSDEKGRDEKPVTDDDPPPEQHPRDGSLPPEEQPTEDPSEEDVDPNDPDADGDEDPDAEGDEDAEMAPEPDARHIACPNCGHEFAMPLPSEGDMTLTEDDEEQSAQDRNPTEKPTTKTASEEKHMPLKDTLDHLAGLVAKDADAAEEEPTTTESAEDVGKTVEDPSEVAKMVAASHEDLTGKLSDMEESLGKAFGLIADAIQDIHKTVDDLPQGRKSVARILPPNSEIDPDAEPSIAKQIADAPDALTALKALNQATYGIQ